MYVYVNYNIYIYIYIYYPYISLHPVRKLGGSLRAWRARNRVWGSAGMSFPGSEAREGSRRISKGSHCIARLDISWPSLAVKTVGDHMLVGMGENSPPILV